MNLLLRRSNPSRKTPACLGVVLGALSFCVLFFPLALCAQPAVFSGGGSWQGVDQFLENTAETAPSSQDKNAKERPQQAQASQTPSPPASQEHAKQGLQNAQPKAKEKTKPEAETKSVQTPADESAHVFVGSTEDERDRALLSKALAPAAKTSDRQAPAAALGSVGSSSSLPNVALPSAPSVAEALPSPEPTSRLKIRLAGLPNLSIKPIPPGSAVRQHKKQAKKKVQKPKITVSKEACEALASLRKRELSAIEKDKETLAALQAAIKDLGLSGQLSFIKEKGTLLDASSTARKAQSPVPR